MLLGKKFEEIEGKVVTILDPHYDGGFPIQSTVHELKDKDGKVVNHVAFDCSGQIHGVVCKCDQLWFDNTTSYGSVGKTAKEVIGWCYDRDLYTIDGYISSGYYKEHVAS